MGTRSFVHLHTHSSHSLRDSIATIPALVSAAASDGQPALAITDHGSLGAIWQLTSAAEAAGITAIPGEELYLAFGSRRERNWGTGAGDGDGPGDGDGDTEPGAGGALGVDLGKASEGTKRRAYMHLTVLATDPTGWANLMAISAASNDPEAYWHKPRVDLELLSEHAEGLVILTGCLGGPVAGPLAAGDRAGAEANLAALVELAGAANVYVEVMSHGIATEQRILPELVGLARRFGLRVVATNDAHHVAAGEAKAHDAWLCMGSDSTIDDPGRWRFHGDGYHLRSAAEMRALFDGQPGTEGACDATLEIASRVSGRVIAAPGRYLPRYRPLPDGETSESLLYRLVAEGAAERYGTPLPPAVRSRLRHEYEVICSQGFSDYFLIVSDMVSWAHSQGIRVGPGRGCLAGDSRVWTADGYKPISDVHAGDLVRTHTGAVRPVARTFRYEVDEQLVTIRAVNDGEGVSMTADHKVLVRRAERVRADSETVRDRTRSRAGCVFSDQITSPLEWVPAAQVAVGDLVCIPRPVSTVTAPREIDVAPLLGPAPGRTRFVVTDSEIVELVPTNKPYPHSVRDVSKSSGVARNVIQSLRARGVPDAGAILSTCRDEVVRRATASERSRDALVADLRRRGFETIAEWDAYVGRACFYEVRTPRFVRVDEAFCFLLGAWASNGWLRSEGERVTGFAERSSMASGDLQLAVKRVWGLDVTTLRRKETDLVQYDVRSAAVRALFRSLFGGYEYTAQTKHLPAWVGGLDDHHRRALLDGLWWGDGSRSEKYRWAYSTSSPALMHSVRDLLWSVGAPAGVTVDDRIDERPEFAEHSPAWRVRTTPDYRPARVTFGGADDRYVYARVRSVTTERRVREVFDLEVPVDHSFMTDSYVVHNSAGGSAVAYCLGITRLEPIGNGLLFERFLDPGRAGMPDIDTDFEARARDRVIDYLRRRWGADNVARLGTVGYIRSRSALKSAGKVLDLPTVGNLLSTKVTLGAGGQPLPIAQLIDPEVVDAAPFRQAVLDNGSPAKRIVSLARRWEGVASSVGIHACGVLVSDVALTERVPLRRDHSKASYQGWISEWDGWDCDALGVLKLDALGLRNLDMLADTAETVARVHHETFDPDNVPVDPGADPAAASAWRLIAEGRTSGCFQLETDGMRQLCRDVAPGNIGELADVIALFRPGPLGENMHTLYADRKAGRGSKDFYANYTSDPKEAAVLAEVLGGTKGCVIYQESMMALGRVVAGFDAATTSRLRKAISKKKPAEMAAVGELFLAGATSDRASDGSEKLAFSPRSAEKVWKAIVSAGAYAFVKAHAYGYATLAYATAYAKANWPAAYGAAMLANTSDEHRRLAMIRSLREEGVPVVGPDVCHPNLVASAGADGVVRLGLSEVKGVSTEAMAALVASVASEGPPSGLADLIRRRRPAEPALSSETPVPETLPGGDPRRDDTDPPPVAQPASEPEPSEPEPSEPGPAEPELPSTGAKRGRSGGERPWLLSYGDAERLIAAGALDSFGPRLGMIQVLWALRDCPELPIPSSEWGAAERSARERLLLGVGITTSPLITLSDQLSTWRSPERTHPAPVELAALTRPEVDPHNRYVTIATISRAKLETKGKRRMYLTVEDHSGLSLDGVIWSDRLAALEAEGRVPKVGDIAGLVVVVRTRENLVEVPSEDPDATEPVYETRLVTDLTVSEVFTGPLDDPSIPDGLPPLPIPAPPDPPGGPGGRRRRTVTRPAGDEPQRRAAPVALISMAGAGRPIQLGRSPLKAILDGSPVNGSAARHTPDLSHTNQEHTR